MTKRTVIRRRRGLGPRRAHARGDRQGAPVVVECCGEGEPRAPTLPTVFATQGITTSLPIARFCSMYAWAADDPGLIPLDRVFALDDIAAAHAYMEQNRAIGKLVVIP